MRKITEWLNNSAAPGGHVEQALDTHIETVDMMVDTILKASYAGNPVPLGAAARMAEHNIDYLNEAYDNALRILKYWRDYNGNI